MIHPAESHCPATPSPGKMPAPIPTSQRCHPQHAACNKTEWHYDEVRATRIQRQTLDADSPPMQNAVHNEKHELHPGTLPRDVEAPAATSIANEIKSEWHSRAS